MNQDLTTILTKPTGASAASEWPLIGVVAASLTLVGVAFYPALSNSFVWDDLPTIVGNASYRGFDAQHLQWMFTTSYGGHYQPLSWLSLALDEKNWGADDAFGFHLTNMWLHAGAGVIIFFLARRLLEPFPREQSPFSRSVPPLNPPLVRGEEREPTSLETAPVSGGRVSATRPYWLGAVVASAFFLVHPLRVESVAWATERRDLLSGLFLLLCVWCYLRRHTTDDRAGRRRWLAASMGCYVLSLLSKATGMTLPLVLLILDAYPLGRFRRNHTAGKLRAVFTEKVWYVVPAALAAWMAVRAQSQAGAMWSFAEHPLSVRIGQAFYGLAFYPLKTLWPSGLVPLYEQQPHAAMLDMGNVLGGVLVIGATVLLWHFRKRAPALLAMWGAYVVLVSPMLGLAQSGPQVVADRYSYVACMPFALMLGAGVQRIWTRISHTGSVLRIMLMVLFPAIAVALVATTRAQTRIWRNPLTLWSTTLERAPDTPSAHAALGTIYYNRGDVKLAWQHSQAALHDLPGNLSAHITLAKSSLALGDGVTAERSFRTALDISSNLGRTNIDLVAGLAEALALQGRWDEAVAIDASLLDNPPRLLTSEERAIAETSLQRHKNRQLMEVHPEGQ